MFNEMNRMPFLNNQNAMFLCGSKKMFSKINKIKMKRCKNQ